MEIQGKIIEIQPIQNIKDSFQKREFVLEYKENPMYPEYIKFELIQDKCVLLDSFKVNDEVKVSFNLKGRKWTDRDGVVKYFNSLQGWKVERAGAASAVPVNEMPPPPSSEPMGNDTDEDSLPF